VNAPSRIAPEVCARSVYEQRYPDAAVVFLAGSVIRGESTRFSDLDLVVVYERTHHAYRESFIAHQWPIEVFVHDRETLNYFFATDRASGVPTLASMIADGIAFPSESDFARSIKQSAVEVLHAGPPPWLDEQRKLSRYLLTDLIEDLREPRSRAEFHASVSRLYEMLATHFFRSRGVWSAKGKAIVRRLQEVDRSTAHAFSNAFEIAFRTDDTAALISLATMILDADGGFLFDGYRADAPAEWRTH
jgi:hypothetical protein